MMILCLWLGMCLNFFMDILEYISASVEANEGEDAACVFLLLLVDGLGEELMLVMLLKFYDESGECVCVCLMFGLDYEFYRRDRVRVFARVVNRGCVLAVFCMLDYYECVGIVIGI